LSYHDGDHYNSVRLKGDLSNAKPVDIPEVLELVESPQQENNQFVECAKLIQEFYGVDNIGKIVKVLKKLYSDVPDEEIVLENIGKIMDEVYSEDYEEVKYEKTGKTDEKNEKKTDAKLANGKKPRKLPNNKEKCWCGSLKIYKKCCKATDYLREEEEEKTITKLATLQI
jgi:hypothetical protein